MISAFCVPWQGNWKVQIDDLCIMRRGQQLIMSFLRVKISYDASMKGLREFDHWVSSVYWIQESLH